MFISLLNAAAAIHNFCDSCHSMYSLATNALTSIIVLHLVTFYSLILGKSQAIEFSKATQKPTKSKVFPYIILKAKVQSSAHIQQNIKNF